MEGKPIVVGLPYYPLSPLGRPGKILFYGEAYFSPVAGDMYFFALATPHKPGDEAPMSARRLRPRLAPGDYAEAAMRAAARILEEAATPGASFHVGGFRGILKAIFSHIARRSEGNPIRATPRLEWRLAGDYITRVLGISSGVKLQVAGPPYYLKVSFRYMPDGTIAATFWRNGREERFRVLELLAKRVSEVRAAAEEVLGTQWGEGQ